MKPTGIFGFKINTPQKNDAFLSIDINLKKTILIFILNLGILSVVAQPAFKIEGSLQAKNSNEAIPFATIALHQTSDSSLVSGTISNADGNFELGTSAPDEYFLEISHLGYDPE
ncbi:MAG: carboxypeptidase-like regulatory domain-containing protein, partial [Tangfeifania sp.]